MNEKTIIVASNNKGKLKEIKAILCDYKIISIKEAGIQSDPEENEMTFEGNALKKARDAKAFTKHMVIADDSGLEVLCLNNIPGVFSKRFYAYYDKKFRNKLVEDSEIDKLNTTALLKLMKNVKPEHRNARFVSKIALIKPDGSYVVFSGECEGIITSELRGERGFGYDPVFQPKGYDKTFAQMTDEQKNGFSHRAKALNKLKEYLDD